VAPPGKSQQCGFSPLNKIKQNMLRLLTILSFCCLHWHVIMTWLHLFCRILEAWSRFYFSRFVQIWAQERMAIVPY